eukprot:180779_1
MYFCFLFDKWIVCDLWFVFSFLFRNDVIIHRQSAMIYYDVQCKQKQVRCSSIQITSPNHFITSAIEMVDVASSMYAGVRPMEDGRTLANCLGNNALRFATVPSKSVADNLQKEHDRYNQLISKINSDHSAISHLFRSKSSGVGRPEFQYGIWFRYFDDLDFENKNPWVDYTDLMGCGHDQNDALFILEPSGIIVNPILRTNHTTADKFEQILRKNVPNFPKSFRVAIKEVDCKLAQQIKCSLYCSARACPMNCTVIIPKMAIREGMKEFKISIIFGPKDGHCIHVNGAQEQSNKKDSKLKDYKDLTKIGEVVSNVLTINDMITDANVEDVLSGVNQDCPYNINQLKNKNKALRAAHYDWGHDDIETIRKVQQATYKRDCEFNEEAISNDNGYYFGEIRFLNWIYPALVMIWNYTSIILVWIFVIDIFLDFTEGLVSPFENYPLYNLIASVACPLGGVVSYPLFECITHRPNGECVMLTFLWFFKSFRVFTSAVAWKKKPKYIHCDRFKGFLAGIYKGSGYYGHHYNYLLTSIMAINNQDLSLLSKYWFRLCYCNTHTMLAIGTHKVNIKTWPKKKQWGHLALMMELHQYIITALNVTDLLAAVNTLKLVLTVSEMSTNTQIEFDYFTMDSLISTLQHKLEKLQDGESDDTLDDQKEMKKTSEIAADIHTVKEIYDWENPIEAQRQEFDLNCNDFMTNTALNRFETMEYILFRPFAKYRNVVIILDKKSMRSWIMPYNVSFNALIISDDGNISNVTCASDDWTYYVAEHMTNIGCTSHIVIGGSMFSNNIPAEETNRFKKNQMKMWKKPTLGQYVSCVAANREKIRRGIYIREKDICARASWTALKQGNVDNEGDIEMDDGITLKNKNENKLAKSDEHYETCILLQRFYNAQKATTYAECARILEKEISSTQIIDEHKTLMASFSKKKWYNTVRILLKVEYLTSAQRKQATLLKQWLKYYLQSIVHH